ncbi:MAG TPA: sigma-70 family RNA polymerase sigma factor, partial [Chitinophagaceae bacterium]|nr:sigma-70 family RNA polymerase sigma factor [Chitinophagaceae bacterium]
LKNISNPQGSDRELVELFKSTGDMKILGSLYERYMELVYGVCLKYLQDVELAKDSVMQIFEELGPRLQKHEVEHFKSWLYTVSKNHCLMLLRSPKNVRTIGLNTETMQSGEEMHLNGIFRKEADFEKLEKCLEGLSPEQKQSVELFYLQQKCYKDIAEITGKDLNKIRSLIQNGRRNLKNCMDVSSSVQKAR